MIIELDYEIHRKLPCFFHL